MGKVSWTDEAARWLREIHDYIAEDDPEAADRVVAEIFDRADSLARLPDLGHRYQARTGRHIRILLYGNYRIAYLLKDNDDVDILGVFHGALDITRHLRG